MEKDGIHKSGNYSVARSDQIRTNNENRSEVSVDKGQFEKRNQDCSKYGIVDVTGKENKVLNTDKGRTLKLDLGTAFEMEGEESNLDADIRDGDFEKDLERRECISKESFETYSWAKHKLYNLHNQRFSDNFGKNKSMKQTLSEVCREDEGLESVLDLNNDDDCDDRENDEDEHILDESSDVCKPTLLELAQLAQKPVMFPTSLSKSRSHFRSDTGELLPLTDGPLDLPPPPPPFNAPQPPPILNSLASSRSVLPNNPLQTFGSPPPPPPPPPLPPQTDTVVCKKGQVRRTKSSMTQSTVVDDTPVPGPSNSDTSLAFPALIRENSEVDGDLNVAREQLRIMIDSLRRFVPLNHPDPDNMQLEELQTAIMDFRYLEQALLDPDDYLDFEDFAGFNLDLPRFSEKVAEPAFARGVEMKTECQICYDDVKLYKRICCDFPVCDPCMEMYIETSVNQGIVKIQCVGSSCDAYLYRDEILGRLSVPMKDKYYKYLVDANKDPKVKTCPRCSNIHNICDIDLENKTKYGLYVTCPDCQLEWCFECQAPWHKDVKCKEFRKGDKLVKSWAKEKHYGNANAQKCPKCKIFIERKGGCDHMTCSKCDTGFCYKCGGRYLDMKFFGNHLSRYSPLGCKYNFKPNRPVLRKLIRGSVFGAKLLGGVVLVSLGVAAVGVLLGASVVILPAFGRTSIANTGSSNGG